MGPGHEVATAFTGPTGHFTFVDVPDGQHTIVTGRGTPSVGPVQPGGSGAIATTSLQTLATLTGGVTAVDRFFGRTPVAISGTDRGDVVVRLRQGVSMTGRIAIDTPEDLTALNQRGTRLQVAAEPAVAVSTLRAGVVSSVPLSATALDFTLAGLRPGDYVLRMYADSGTIKSIMWGGKDYAGLPITVADQDLPGLVITVTSQAPRLEGRVREADGAAAWAASVIYFPEDRSRWRQYGPQPDRLRSVPVRNGIFEIPKMPAGDYDLVAVDEGLADRWRDPAFLESAARVATRVAIGWGETRTQDLTVMEVTR
jgi:hypothetical protein